MGIVVDGKLYQGSSGIGAEFGHMVIEPDGEPCRCGKRGCIEAYAADSGILQQARKLLSKRRNPPDLDLVNIEEITRMAVDGDQGLRRIFQRSGESLAIGISGLIQIFNPERIIITGEGVRAADLVFKPMRRLLKKLVNKPQAEATRVMVQEWNDHDWAQGAAGFVLSQIYRSPLNRIRKTGGTD
jgi:predicted NBD/HSP70 family sugar kinase